MDKEAKRRITKAVVDATAAPSAGEVRVWDTAVKGFCLRVYASGRRTYAVKYRLGGRQRWATIGEHGAAWTPDAARGEAVDILRAASRGVDLVAERKARPEETVAEMIDWYLAEGPRLKPDKRAASWVQDASNLNRHVRPLLGRRVVSELTQADLTRMVADISAGRTAANLKTGPRGRAIVRGGAGVAQRVYSTARAMFATAITAKRMKPPNPAQGYRLPARPSAERFLTAGQAKAIMDALSGLEAEGTITMQQASIFRLLLLTGARRREIAGLRWSEVDLGNRCLLLPPERTKAGGKSGTRRIALSGPAVAILRQLDGLRKARQAFVFPATKGKSGATTSEAKIWRTKVLPRAKLTGVRIHDLRHSFASFALADGASLAVIGKALGHASMRATERYARLSDDPIKDLAERIGSRFGDAG